MFLKNKIGAHFMWGVGGVKAEVGRGPLYYTFLFLHPSLMQRISLSHPEEKFIHWFPQNMEGAWPATPLFKKWKEAQILVAGFIPSFYAKFHEIW